MRAISPKFGYELSGKRYGMLTVVSYDGHGLWRCKCDCGNEKVIKGSNLLTGHVMSCGCYGKNKLGNHVRKHGGTGTRLYRIWMLMRYRCSNENNPSYKNYGGRGIKVCDEWQDSFIVFRDWALKHGYRDDLTIDRIDNDKGYSPDNCRWIYYKDQPKNRRSNHRSYIRSQNNR